MSVTGNGTERASWDHQKHALCKCYKFTFIVQGANFIHTVPDDKTQKLLFTRRLTSGCTWNHSAIVKASTLLVMSLFG